MVASAGTVTTGAIDPIAQLSAFCRANGLWLHIDGAYGALTALSPRFVPNDIFQVAEIPRTLSGKKQELPIKKLLLGQPLEKVINREAMANPGCLDWYVAFAVQRQERS